MATRKELEEKYDDCQETTDYVAVALGAFKDLDDKDWAATAQDFLALSTSAKVILGDTEKATEYFEQAKEVLPQATGSCNSGADFSALGRQSLWRHNSASQG